MRHVTHDVNHYQRSRLVSRVLFVSCGTAHPGRRDCDSSQTIRAAAQVWAVWMGSLEVHVDWDTSFPIVQSATGSAVTWRDSFASCFTQIAELAHCSLWGRKRNTSTSSKQKNRYFQCFLGMASRQNSFFSKTEVVINLNVLKTCYFYSSWFQTWATYRDDTLLVKS